MTRKRMLPFVTDTWNPVAGGFTYGIKSETGKMDIVACPYRCIYCWARRLINQRQWKKYTGPYRIHEPEINRKFKPGSIVFACDMIDIGVPTIPEEVIKRLLDAMRAQPEVQFLLLTKNPQFYRSWSPLIPENTIWGATVETNRIVDYRISRAPDTAGRLDIMIKLAEEFPDQKRFVCIEPVMDFDIEDFLNRLWRINLEATAVGYDNYGYDLPEPSLEKTMSLIRRLERITTVHRKTLREPRHSTPKVKNDV